MPEPHTHLFHAEVRIGDAATPTDFVMPSWTPGSYLLREFPRNVQDFRAEDGHGAAVPWHKTDKNTWRVEASGGELRIRYAVYANELTVRTSHLDASHGYVNGANVFMYPEGRQNEPVSLVIDAPGAWRITTGLCTTGIPNEFRAADYDELADSPIEIGTHELIEWEIDGRPHRYAIWGRGNYDPGRLIGDTNRIILACKELFGSLPYEQYTFLVHLLPGGSGGLEHRNSASLQADRWAFCGREYEQFLALVAHEFFHIWNGKRIRPEPLGAPDYTRENYTRSLWIVEGLTTYYTDQILRRAEIISPERYLERLGEAIGRLQAVPGRRVQTLEESSFDTWIKFYRPDEHTPNSQVSYYQKGALAGLLLDLKIRGATADRRSLDDVMRQLWERYGAHNLPYPERGDGGIEVIAAEVCGEDLGPFFDQYIRSAEELDFNHYLAAAGLGIRAGRSDGPDTASRAADSATPANAEPAPGAAGPAPDAHLGVRLKEATGRPLVTHVLADTPAHRAGLNAGDELVALNGLRVTPRSLAAQLDAARPGDPLVFTVFRRDELAILEVSLGAPALPAVQIVPLPERTPAQESVYQGWLRADRPAGPPVDGDRAEV